MGRSTYLSDVKVRPCSGRGARSSRRKELGCCGRSVRSLPDPLTLPPVAPRIVRVVSGCRGRLERFGFWSINHSVGPWGLDDYESKADIAPVGLRRLICGLGMGSIIRGLFADRAWTVMPGRRYCTTRTVEPLCRESRILLGSAWMARACLCRSRFALTVHEGRATTRWRGAWQTG